MNAETEPVYGRHPVREVLRGGHRPVQELAVLAEARGPALQDLLHLARRQGVKVVFRTREQLSALARTPHHQGVVARVAAQAYASLESLLVRSRALGHAPLFLALDQVQDPGNLGNLIRTAEALGAHGMLVPRHEAVGLTPVVAKSAAGALEHLPVARVGNLTQALDVLKGEGCWVVGGATAGAGTVPPWALDLRGPTVLVLGGEGRGLRPLVARSCDALTRIPLTGQVGSLNVAAAGAALLYEVCRQRSRPPGGPAQKEESG